MKFVRIAGRRHEYFNSGVNATLGGLIIALGHDIGGGSGAEVLQMLKIHLPDIILFALGNPGLEELKTLKILCESLPETPILVLTSSEVPGQEQAALEAGVQVMLTRAASSDEIIRALRARRRQNPIGHHQNILGQEASRDTSHS